MILLYILAHFSNCPGKSGYNKAREVAVTSEAQGYRGFVHLSDNVSVFKL